MSVDEDVPRPREQDEEPQRLARERARRLNLLFDAIKRPNGKRYGLRDVAEWIGEQGAGPSYSVSYTHIGHLRSGKVLDPGVFTLGMIARFFGVPPEFLAYPDRDSADAASPSVEEIVKAAQLRRRLSAFRTMILEPASQELSALTQDMQELSALTQDMHEILSTIRKMERGA